MEPYDFGAGTEKIFRALELNRRLLYHSGSRARTDREAFENKIDELLDRMLETREMGFGASR